MKNMLKTHLVNDYIVKMQLLEDGLYKLVYPANNKLGLPAKEVQFKLDDIGMEISCGDFIKRIDIEGPSRLAFILVYTNLEQLLRKMSRELFCVFDVNNNYIGSDLYDVLELSNDERLKVYIAGQLLSSESKDNLYLKHFEEILHA